MGYHPNRNYIIESMKAFIETPSPVSYYEETNALLERYALALGYQVTYDKKTHPQFKSWVKILQKPSVSVLTLILLD